MDLMKILQKIQREIGKTGNVVAEGRDMGSFVFPDADIKIFMTADLKERARRRWKELKEKGIFPIDNFGAKCSVAV